MLENLTPNTLPRLLRRTTIATLIVAALAFFGSLLLNVPPMGSLGLLVGVGLAIANLSFLDRQTATVEMKGEQTPKAIRRQLGGKTVLRLSIMTVIVGVAVMCDHVLGIGIVSGLVLFQIVFVANVLRVVAQQGGSE